MRAGAPWNSSKSACASDRRAGITSCSPSGKAAFSGTAATGPSLQSYDLYWIAVRKETQGTGIGRMLLEKSEAAIAEIGGRRVYIETSSKAMYRDTRRFYERNGYRAEATLKEFYSPGDSKVIYVKALPERQEVTKV